MSSQIAQNYSTQDEATLNHLVNLYLQSPAPASLWASISTMRATFPKNWPRRRTRALSLLKSQNQRCSKIFQDMQKPPPDE